MMTLNPLSNLFAQLEAQAKAVEPSPTVPSIAKPPSDELQHKAGPMQNRTGLPPHTLLVRVANLLGVHRDYLLEQGFLEPCDLEEQAATDPWVLAEGIRLDPRWCKPPTSAKQTKPHEPVGQGEPQAHAVHWTAHIAPVEWLQARDAYLNHLAACPECWAPIGRYCLEGAGLNLEYRDIVRDISRDFRGS